MIVVAGILKVRGRHDIEGEALRMTKPRKKELGLLERFETVDA